MELISIIRRSFPLLEGVMRKHLTGLDHAVIRVDDLDRASDDFAAMGFTLSPRGRHTLGTENRCVMFGFDYIELLWVPPGVDAPFYASADEEGMSALALKSTDVADLHDAWAKSGLEPEPWVEFSRPVEIGAGQSADARFRACALPATRTPGGRAFACQHFTPELVWRRGLSRHRNLVTGINKIAIVADDPASVALAWGGIFDMPRHPIPGGVAINTGAAPIVVLRPDAVERQLAGIAIETSRSPTFAAIYLSCSDLKVAAAVLHAGGQRPVALADGSLALPPADAHGIALVFK